VFKSTSHASKHWRIGEGKEKKEKSTSRSEKSKSSHGDHYNSVPTIGNGRTWNKELSEISHITSCNYKLWGSECFLQVLYFFLGGLNSSKRVLLRLSDNNQKCLSLHQISIVEWFLKDHVTLKTRVMMLKIQL